MPYFKWVGVDIVANVYKGRMAAHSADDLSERLLGRGIAMMRCQSCFTFSFLYSVSAGVKAQVFESIASLLRAGLMVPDVFTTVAQQLNNPMIYDALFTWTADLKNGLSFASAIKKHNQLCDPIVTTMLIVGNESGDIAQAMENAAHYYRMKYEFKKGVRSCLAMPLMTLIFFVGISLFIFIGIMPQFAALFSSMNTQLPAVTRYMLDVSSFLLSWSVFNYAVFLVLCAVVLLCYYKEVSKKIVHRICMSTPFVAAHIKHHELGQFLHALSLLVKSNVPLLQSLDILQASTHNHVIKQYIGCLYNDVHSGRLLSHAMAAQFIFPSDIVALVAVGEEAGELGVALFSAADIYKRAVQRSLDRLLFIMQPLVIIILGFLIGTLILAVYLPIMSLSYAI